jgi:hypothetical protein
MPATNRFQLETAPASPARAAAAWLTPGRFALLLGILILTAFPDVLLGRRTFVFRDFGLFGYPLAHFHRESFWRGELPLWNPLNHCGIPFLAQWNTLSLYPFSLLYLLLPLTWSLPFFCLAHLFWGGLGMYVLAQHWTRNRLAAALAGVVFSFNGLSLNALMWPNIEAALGWLPWVIYLGQRGWREGGKTLVWAVLAAAMQFLAGGPEPLLFTWLILFVLACGDGITGEAVASKVFLRLGLTALLVALVCAIQLLPFLDLLAHSQRSRGFGSSSHDWSMPFWGWANFLVPLFRTTPTAQGVYFQNGQYWTSSYYAGVGTLLLALVAVRCMRDLRVWLLAGLVFLGAVLALGDCTLLYGLVQACVPGAGFLRYPVKAVILVLALAPLLAAFGVTALMENSQASARRFAMGAALLFLLLIGAVVAWDCKAPIGAEAWRATWHSGLSRAVFLLVVVLLGAGFLGAHGLGRTVLGLLLLIVFWLDLVTHVPAQNPTAPPSVYAPGLVNAKVKWEPKPQLGTARAMLSPAGRDVVRFAIADPEQNYLRSRLATYPDCNLLDGVPEIDGFFSVVPREIARVTALPYEQRDRAFPPLLDFMGVAQMTVGGSTSDWRARPTAMPIVTAGQQPVFAEESKAFEALCQTNVDLRRVVYLPPEARGAVAAGPQPTARARVTEFSNRRVTLATDAPRPTVVVIAQAYYPAWKAYVDGRPAKLWRANYAFQAVEVPAGKHELRLRYEDKWLRAGAALSVLGLLACAGLWLGATRFGLGFGPTGDTFLAHGR